MEWNDEGKIVEQLPPAEDLFSRDYFNGGTKWGGYAREGMWDFPCHEITVRHLLARKPESVLELGCARGYIIKRVQDAGIPAIGLEVSDHCQLTRVCDGITQINLCKPWPYKFGIDYKVDMCFSIATFEHIPESCLPEVLAEIRRSCKRGFHGIDFGEQDDGFDKTHCTLRSRDWWVAKFDEAGLYNHEIVNKQELEQGQFPLDVLNGDGKLKLNVGCGTTMHHYGWTNIDTHDLGQFAQRYSYKYFRHDVRNGLPFQTQSVDFINASHFLQALTYREAVEFFRESRRALKLGGVMRISVPDVMNMVRVYKENNDLSKFNELHPDIGAAKTDAQRLWTLIAEGDRSFWDYETLNCLLGDVGFHLVNEHSFRHGNKQILKETLDILPDVSFYTEATSL
jgi:predicted SAM-dependent methyltransferase